VREVVGRYGKHHAAQRRAQRSARSLARGKLGQPFAVAGAQESTLQRIKGQAPVVKRWGGHVLITLGLWFIALAVFADFFAELFPV